MVSSMDQHAPSAIRFAIIADDLTGACDSASAFAQRGLPTEVLLEPDAIPPIEGIWAISTESRDLAERSAVQRVREMVSRIPDDVAVFKKVDSVFRGNSFAEIRAVIECLSFDFAVLSPAYPQMGRKVRDGILHVEDAAGERTLDLQDGLHKVGLKNVILIATENSTTSLPSRLQDAAQTGANLLLCDAESVEDMQRIVAASRNLCKRILWIGSGGLAHAIAAELPQGEVQRERKPIEGCIVLFVGSDHPVTQKQLANLRDNFPMLESSVEGFSGISSEHQFVLLSVTRGITTEERIRRAAALLVSHGIACCLMTGGDTAALVCRALEVRSLELIGEFAPGLPQGTAIGGVLNQSPIVLKSGGFGTEDVLCQLSQRFVSRKELV